jgi:hypothetical protein
VGRRRVGAYLTTKRRLLVYVRSNMAPLFREEAEVTGMADVQRRGSSDDRAGTEHVFVPGRVRVGSPGDGEPGENDS